MTDPAPPTAGDDLPATAWVTVAEAAEKSGVGTSTIRQWYRSGRLPTQRAQGDRGAFLVPLDGVLTLSRSDDDADDFTAELIDLNASYWSAQTEAAREEATAAKNDLAQARAELRATTGEVETLRAQLADAEDEARKLRERLEAERAAAPAAVAPEPDAASKEVTELGEELADAEAELDEVRAELEGVRNELEGVRNELADVRRGSEGIQGELTSANAELERTSHDLERTAGQLEVTQRQLQAAQAELAKLKEMASAVGSITDNSWLDLPTNAYRSPVRPQGMAAAAGDAFSGLLAATQPDAGADAPLADPWAAEPELEPIGLAHDPDATDEVVETPAPRPHHQLGHHDDDLLPQPEKKGRRGRR